MRHVIANVATYLLATLLFLGAMTFAWVRSTQLVMTDERALREPLRPSPGQAFEWHALGERSYIRNCRHCHGAEGRGWDQYPGLSHAAGLVKARGGREYLIDVHLYGLTSPRSRAPMPPMGHIGDVELSAVINHLLSSFGNAEQLRGTVPIVMPDEVSVRRGKALSPADVERTRPSFEGAVSQAELD